jgi:uncharacterized membrane protein YhaH (DUF805 family)
MSNISWSNLLFGFTGRINRAKWWLAVLVTVIINLLVSLISAVIPSDLAGGVLALIGFVIMLWISLAAGAKRLHDLNRTAAWLVVFYGVPLLLMIVLIAYAGLAVGTALLTGGVDKLDPAALSGIGGVAAIVGLVALVLSIWALIWFGCLRGTVGANQYGPDPLEAKL